METVNKLLKLLGGMLMGAAVGYFGVMAIIWLVEGSLPSSHGGKEGIDWGMMALSIGVTLVGLFIAVLVHLILHEAGHLIAGLLTGYRFLSFRVFKFTLVKTEDGLRWKKFHIAGTGGQCILELPEDQDVETVPWFWYNAGGVLMNLIIMLLSIGLLRLLNPGVVGFALLAMLAFVGLFMAMMNGVPANIGGISNDGHNIWMLWRRPAERRYFLRSLQIAGQLSRGKRMSEMPEEWTEDRPITEKSSYLELMTINRQEVINVLWTKQVARYTEAGSKYSPIKCAVLYAYELLYNHDAEKAEGYKRQLEVHKNGYTMPGEALTALRLI